MSAFLGNDLSFLSEARSALPMMRDVTSQEETHVVLGFRFTGCDSAVEGMRCNNVSHLMGTPSGMERVLRALVVLESGSELSCALGRV